MNEDYIAVNRQAYSILANGYYDKIANQYENITYTLCDSVWNGYIKVNQGKKPETVLELGPGSGKALYSFSTKYNCNTTAIELSHEMASMAKNTAPRAAIIEDDVKNINNLLHHQFDIIYASAFIHLFPTKDATLVLKNASFWLVSSGIMYLSTTLHDQQEEGFFKKSNFDKDIKRYRVRYTEAKFKELIDGCRLEITDEWKTNDKKNNRIWLNIICQKKEEKYG